MKKNAVFRIILFSLTILILSGILAAGIYSGTEKYTRSELRDTLSIWDTGIPESSQEGMAHQQQGDYPNKYTAKGRASEIEIDWAAGKIIIQPGDVASVQVTDTDTDGRYSTYIEEEGNSLSIEYYHDDRIFHGISINDVYTKDLIITVPMDWVCQELDLDVASVQVEISNLTIQEIDFDGASGECRFKNCSVGKLDVDTASGDISFSGTLEALDFDAADASFTADLENTPARINMDSMSGDLELTLPENAGFTVSMDALSSDFFSDFPTTAQYGSQICGDGKCRIDVSGLSGDITIRKCADSSHTACH